MQKMILRSFIILFMGFCGCTKAAISAVSNSLALQPDHLLLIAGDGQTGIAGLPLPVDPKVQVVSRSGTPVPGVPVTFNVSSGGGTVQSSSVVTDSSGFASCPFTLGAIIGVQSLQALTSSNIILTGSPSVIQFNETALSPFLNALNFSGSGGQYLAVTQNTYMYSALNPLTVEAWIQLSSLPTASGMIFNLSLGAMAQNIELYIDNTGHGNIFLPNAGNCTNGSGGYSVAGVLTVGSKHHIALQYDGVNGNLYYDGALQRSNPFSTGGCNLVPSLQIGQGFPGVIDELRFSNSVRYPMGGFTPPTVPFIGDLNTVLLFHFDDGATSGWPSYSNPAATFNFVGAPFYVTSPFP